MMKDSFFRTATTNMTLDYHSVLESISEFRRSNGKSSQVRFDAPQTYYFKLFFYFDNDNDEGKAASDGAVLRSNLLGLTYDGKQFSGLPWKGGQALYPSSDVRDGHVHVNTALNYLLLNYEWDRAKKLTEFITLLSELSYKYPWYFMTVSGLENAITRKEFGANEFKIDEERKSFQIKCLPDAEDNKVGRLLDLYRNIVYSQSMHKEILPANLRKFDMGIFIFSRPLKNIHRGVGKSDIIVSPEKSPWDTPQDTPGEYANFKPNFSYEDMGSQDKYKTSYKYIEFHNCEFDYNSSASAYTELSNAEGFHQEYTINIFYDTAVENRYDEHTMRNIGDFSMWDLNLNSDNISGQEDSFWSIYFEKEQEFASSQEAEYARRKGLLTDKGDDSSPLPSPVMSNVTESIGDYFGVRAKDYVKNGNEVKVGEFWESKLIPENQGMITNAARQIGHTAFNKYVASPFKKFALGNFYAAQIRKTVGAINQIASGNVIGGASQLNNVIKGWKQKS